MRYRFTVLLLWIFIAVGTNTGWAQSDLEGTWIGAYRTDYTNAGPSQQLLRFLIDVRGSQITFRAFPYPNTMQPESVTENPFTREGNLLLIQEPDVTDTLIVTEHTDDKLEYYHKGFESTVYTLRKVRSEPVIVPGHLSGKAFEMVRNGQQVIDTLEFVNDSLLVYYSQLGTEKNACRWQLSYFDDYSFLLLDETFIPPYVVQSVTNGIIYLSLEYLQSIPLQLRPIKRASNLPSLEGQWYLSGRIRNGEHEYYVSPAKTPGGLAVKGNVMTLELDGNTKTRHWHATATGQHIIFSPGSPFFAESWKIVESKPGHLNIQRIISTSPKRTEILEFTMVQ